MAQYTIEELRISVRVDDKETKKDYKRLLRDSIVFVQDLGTTFRAIGKGLLTAFKYFDTFYDTAVQLGGVVKGIGTTFRTLYQDFRIAAAVNPFRAALASSKVILKNFGAVSDISKTLASRGTSRFANLSRSQAIAAQRGLVLSTTDRVARAGLVEGLESFVSSQGPRLSAHLREQYGLVQRLGLSVLQTDRAYRQFLSNQAKFIPTAFNARVFGGFLDGARDMVSSLRRVARGFTTSTYAAANWGKALLRLRGTRIAQEMGSLWRSTFNFFSLGASRSATGAAALARNISFLSTTTFAWAGVAADSFLRLGRNIRRVINILHYGFYSLPFVIAGSTRELQKFQAAENKLAASTGLALDAVRNEYSKFADDIARSTGVNVETIFTTIGRGISNQLRGQELQEGVLLSANLESLGVAQASEALDAATTVTTAYAASNITAAQALDKLLVTGQQGSGEMSSFANALRPNVNLGAKLGIELDDLAASLAVLSKTVQVSEAGTQLRGFLAALLNPTSQAVDALKEVGVEFLDLRKTLAQPGGLVLLIEQLKQLDEQTLTKVFGNIRALSAVLTLTADEVERTSEAIRGAEGEITRQAEAAVATLPQVFGRIKQEALAALRDVGQSIIDQVPVERLEKVMVDFIDILRELGAALAYVIEVVLPFADIVKVIFYMRVLNTIIKPLIFTLFGLAVAWKVLIILLPAVNKLLKVTGVSLTGLTLRTAIFYGTLVLIPALIATLVSALILATIWIVRNWDAVQAWARNVWAALVVFKDALLGVFSLIFDNASATFNNALDFIRGIWRAFTGALSEGFAAFDAFVKRQFDRLIAPVRDFHVYFVEVWRDLPNQAAIGISHIINAIRTLPTRFALVWLTVKKGFVQLIGFMDEQLRKILPSLNNFLGAAAPNLLKAVVAAQELIPAFDAAGRIERLNAEGAALIVELRNITRVTPEDVKRVYGELGSAIVGVGRALNDFSFFGGGDETGGGGGTTTPAGETNVVPLPGAGEISLPESVKVQVQGTTNQLAQEFAGALDESFRERNFGGFLKRLGKRILNAVFRNLSDSIGTRFANIVGFDIPKFHDAGAGKQYRSPAGRGQGIALLKDREWIYEDGMQPAANDKVYGSLQGGLTIVVPQTNVVGTLDEQVEDTMTRKAVNMAHVIDAALEENGHARGRG